MNDVIKIYLDNGILIGEYCNNTLVTLDIAKEIIEHRIKICDGKNVVSLCIIPPKFNITQEAKMYFNSDRAYECIDKCAFLVNTEINRILVLAFINFYKRRKPAKVFSSKEKATRWLLS